MTEDQLTAACYQWWHEHYAEYRGLLWHVPNGGARHLAEANRFKAMGVFPGVSDFLLLWNSRLYCFELKVGTNKQSDHQEYWQMMVEGEGAEYFLIKDLNTFKWTIRNIIGR